MPTPILNSSPAEILEAWLTATGTLLTQIFDEGNWVSYVNKEQVDPDQTIIVYDTTPRYDGRSMGPFVTGKVVEHPGISIRVRSADSATHPGNKIASAKARQILSWLTETINMTPVAVTGDTMPYIIQNYSPTSNVTFIGQEPQSRRQLFTLNGVITVYPNPQGG